MQPNSGEDRPNYSDVTGCKWRWTGTPFLLGPNLNLNLSLIFEVQEKATDPAGDENVCWRLLGIDRRSKGTVMMASS